MDWLKRSHRPPVLRLGERDLPLTISRHPRARRMTMRLAPDGSAIRITLPTWGRTAEALAFARSRARWLESQLAALPVSRPPAPGGTVVFRGRPLEIDWAPVHSRQPVIEEDILRIGGPAESLAPRLRRWLEAEALRLMEEDLAYYCARAGQPLPRLGLSRAQRRWGSCSSARSGLSTIRVNWRLIQAPDAVRRSVVAHEVAHLVHFDHSPSFHALLREVFEDDVSAADRWLKQEGRSLYSAFG